MRKSLTRNVYIRQAQQRNNMELLKLTINEENNMEPIRRMQINKK